MAQDGVVLTKSEVVEKAVTDELRKEGKSSPSTGNELMGADYLYNEITMAGFLRGVSALLSGNTPSYKFVSTSLSPTTCLTRTVAELCGDISGATS
jgi:hypothetical protein